MTSYSLDQITRKQLPESELYVEDNIGTAWHRHVELNGPGPEAYAAYNIAAIELEERMACLK